MDDADNHALGAAQFRELYISNYEKIRNRCAAFTFSENHLSAEDLAQDVFLALWVKTRNGPLKHPNPTAWLLKIAKNKCINKHRPRSKRAKVEVVSDKEWNRTALSSQASPGALEQFLSVEEILGALARLSKTHRETVLKVVWYKKSYEEIAEEEGIKVATVRKRIDRSLTQLDKQMPPERRSTAAILSALCALGGVTSAADLIHTSAAHTAKRWFEFSSFTPSVNYSLLMVAVASVLTLVVVTDSPVDIRREAPKEIPNGILIPTPVSSEQDTVGSATNQGASPVLNPDPPIRSPYADSKQNAELGWIKLDPSVIGAGPGPVIGHRLSYFEPLKRIILFGGMNDGGMSDETWTFDGKKWQALALSSRPPARWYHTMSYDKNAGAIVMFGGQDSEGHDMNDTWLFDGTGWQEVITGRAPSPRLLSSSWYSENEGTVFLFGGVQTISRTFLDGDGRPIDVATGRHEDNVRRLCDAWHFYASSSESVGAFRLRQMPEGVK